MASVSDGQPAVDRDETISLHAYGKLISVVESVVST